MNKLHISGMLSLVAMTTGCASIIHGQNQSLSVETRNKAAQVAGATCKLSNDKGTWYVTSPGSTTVHRSFEALSVRCEKDDLPPGLTTAKSSTKAMAFGNILFGGIIGAGVDIANGSAYDYPSLITVEMGETTETVIAPAPQAGTSPSEPARN
jgi:hypothetical protein